jgi:Fibronectin type III domain
LTVASSSQINLHWNDNSSNETQFLIERSPNGTSFTQVVTVGANVLSYSATGLQSNTRYYFRVRATNSAGNSAYSNTANAKLRRTDRVRFPEKFCSRPLRCS